MYFIFYAIRNLFPLNDHTLFDHIPGDGLRLYDPVPANQSRWWTLWKIL